MSPPDGFSLRTDEIPESMVYQTLANAMPMEENVEDELAQLAVQPHTKPARLITSTNRVGFTAFEEAPQRHPVRPSTRATKPALPISKERPDRQTMVEARNLAAARDIFRHILCEISHEIDASVARHESAARNVCTMRAQQQQLQRLTSQQRQLAAAVQRLHGSSYFRGVPPARKTHRQSPAQAA